MRFRLAQRSMTLDDLELENNLLSSFRRQYLANNIRTAVARIPLRQSIRFLVKTCRQYSINLSPMSRDWLNIIDTTVQWTYIAIFGAESAACCEDVWRSSPVCLPFPTLTDLTVFNHNTSLFVFTSSTIFDSGGRAPPRLPIVATCLHRIIKINGTILGWGKCVFVHPPKFSESRPPRPVPNLRNHLSKCDVSVYCLVSTVFAIPAYEQCSLISRVSVIREATKKSCITDNGMFRYLWTLGENYGLSGVFTCFSPGLLKKRQGR